MQWLTGCYVHKNSFVLSFTRRIAHDMQHVPSSYRHHREAWFRSRQWRRGRISMEKEYTWRNPLMPILNIFKLLGRMPFYRVGEGSTLKFKLFSTPVMWAVISNCALIVYVGRIYYWKITHGQYWRNFDEALMSINELTILNSSFHGLEATWAATPAIVRAVNRWEAYQKRLYAISRRPITTKFLDHSYVGLVVMVIPSTHLFVQHLLMGEVDSLFHIIKEVVYCVCIYYNCIVFWLWIILCSLVIRAGKVLKDSFIKSTSTFPTPEVLSLQRDIWLELHGCAKDMASALATTLIAWKVLMFSVVLFGSYGLIVYIKTFNYALLVTYIVLLTIINFIGYLTYSYGSFAQQAMSQNILLAIMSRRWVHLSRRSLRELELLLDCIQMGKPCFDMRGFFIFDRNTLIKMYQLLLTYLVIVVQLKEQLTV